MVIKYFDEFEGKWLDISGNTGSVLTKGVDGWETSSGYLKLVLLISQTGTDDPTYTELENTINVNYNLNRQDVGLYRLDFEAFILSQGKTFLLIQQNNDSRTLAYRDSDYRIVFDTIEDDILNFTSFELRIYN